MVKVILFILALNASLFSFEIDLKELTEHSLSVAAPQSPNCTVDLEGEPSYFANGCVNVITGNYSYMTTDVTIPGIYPIKIERAYNKKKKQKMQNQDESKEIALFEGWYLNHDVDLKLYYGGEKAIYESNEGLGSVLIYEGDRGSATLNENGKASSSNIVYGELSGRTNIKNTRIERPEGRYYAMVTGANFRRSFLRKKHHHQKQMKEYYLTEERTPNQNVLRYSYYDDFRLKEIKEISRTGEELSKIQFGFYSKNLLKIKPRIYLFTSDERTVWYDFEKHHSRYILKSVKRADGLTEEYEYDKQDRLTKRIGPGGVFQDIEYYEKEITNLGHGNSVSKEESKKNLDHVKRLLAPVGTDSKPIQTHSFLYEASKTSVFDAFGNRTDYQAFGTCKLKSVTKYVNNTPYSIEKMFWGSYGAPNQGNLISRVFEGEGKNYFCRHFVYDSSGNVLEDKLYGNLSGNCTIPVLIHDDGVPIENGVETYSKQCKYSNNGNLVLEEEDGRKKIVQDYHPNTDLIAYRIVSEGVIKQRQFFDYDRHGSLCEKIIDDGSSFNKNNLENVTERHITRTTNRMSRPFGLPEIVEQLYLDLKTGQEKLLSKVIYSYTLQGQKIAEEHFDNEGQPTFTLHWEYDENGNVISETNALGHLTQRRYNKNGSVIFEQGPRTDTWKEFTYDFSNRLIQTDIILPYGQRLTTQNKYDLRNQLVCQTDTCGNETHYEYNSLGRLYQTVLPNTYNRFGGLVQTFIYKEFDHMGLVVLEQDPNLGRTKYSHNVRGQPYKIEYADGSIERRSYTADGLLERSVAKNGAITTFSHDYLGRVIKTELHSPSGELLSSRSSVYNAFHLIAETDAAGHVTHYDYDSAGRLIRTRKENSCTQCIYDNLNRIKTKIFHYGDQSDQICIIAYEYDRLNRVTEERKEDAYGNVIQKTRYGYDLQGNCSETIEEGQAGISITKKVFNALNEIELIIDPEGNETHLSYDYNYINEHNQRVLAVQTTDPLGNRTLLIHNAHGRISTQIRKNAFGKVLQKEETFYDPAGNKTEVIQTVITPDASDRIIHTSYQYDSSQRLIGLTEAVGTDDQKITRLKYNEYGEKTHIIRPDGTEIIHAYDYQGRLSQYHASDNSFSYTYSYDANGNLTSIQDLIQAQSTLRSYDANDHLVQETLGNGLSMQYAHDYMGRVTHLILPDQSSIEYKYDSFLLKEVSKTKEGIDQYSHQYTEYDLSNRLTKSKCIGNGSNITYDYDLNGRNRAIISPHWQQEMPPDGFDSMGHLLHRKILDAIGPLDCSYTYDDLYQLHTEQGNFSHKYVSDSLFNRVSKDGSLHTINDLNQLLQDAQCTYTYDHNGNLVEKVSDSCHIKYHYDALGRLLSITQNQQQTRYQYDSFNRRLSKENYFLQNSEWTLQNREFYLYTDQNEIGSCNEAGAFLTLRILGIGKGAEIGAAIAIELEGTFYAPIHDHNGNVSCLVNPEDNTVFETYRYSAFGEEQLFDSNGNTISTSANPWRYASKRFDPETGWIYFGRRYYDPQTARWTSQDPIGGTAGPNLYAYVFNNPLVLFDLYGLLAEGQQGKSFIEHVHSFFEYVLDRTERAVSCVGSCIEFTGHNISVPYIGDALEITGRALQKDKDDDYVYSFRRAESYYFAEGTKIDNGVVGHLACGVHVTEKEFKARVKQHSENLGDALVVGCYIADKGLVADALDWFRARIGIETTSARALKESYQYAHSFLPNGKGLIDSQIHSKSGELMNTIRHQLDKDVSKKINLNTYGSPKIIHDDHDQFYKVKNNVGTRDCVCLLDPINYYRACKENPPDVKFIQSDSWHFWDHSWDDMYKQHALNDAKAIRKEKY